MCFKIPSNCRKQNIWNVDDLFSQTSAKTIKVTFKNYCLNTASWRLKIDEFSFAFAIRVSVTLRRLNRSAETARKIWINIFLKIQSNDDVSSYFISKQTTKKYSFKMSINFCSRHSIVATALSSAHFVLLHINYIFLIFLLLTQTLIKNIAWLS